MSGDWRSQGLCGQTDPDLFASERARDIAAAKALCAVCEVQPPCLAWALANGETHTVVGGLSPDERAADPRFVPAQTVSAWLPLAGDDRFAASVRGEARAARIARADAPALDGFSDLRHPTEQGASR